MTVNSDETRMACEGKYYPHRLLTHYLPNQPLSIRTVLESNKKTMNLECRDDVHHNAFEVAVIPQKLGWLAVPLLMASVV